MKYQLSILDKKDYGLLDDLAKSVSLDEELDKLATFIGAFNNNELCGAVGFSFAKETPRLEHIILAKNYQRTRLGVILLKAMENFLEVSGAKQYYSYILNTNERMISYAKKWGLKLKTEGKEGSWFYKSIK